MKDEIRPISEMDVDTAASRLRRRLGAAPKEVQKRLLRALIGEIVVAPDEIAIRGPELRWLKPLMPPGSQRNSR